MIRISILAPTFEPDLSTVETVYSASFIFNTALLPVLLMLVWVMLLDLIARFVADSLSFDRVDLMSRLSCLSRGLFW